MAPSEGPSVKPSQTSSVKPSTAIPPTTSILDDFNKVIILDKGVIVENDSPQNLYDNPKSEFGAHFIGKSSWLDAKHFIRPNDISINKIDKDIKVLSIVRSCEYRGGSYFVEAVNQNIVYSFISNQSYAINDEVCLYYNSKDIKEL